MLNFFNEIVNNFGSDEILSKVNKTFFEPEKENYNFCPPANIYNFENIIKIVLKVPGFLKENIFIDVDGNKVLKINGKNKNKNSETLIREEFRFEDFYRSFQLNEKHDKDKIEAKIENGLLEIIIPLKEKSKSKQIKIN